MRGFAMTGDGDLDLSKRRLIWTAGVTMVSGVVAAAGGLVLPANAEGAKPGARAIDEITPPEDLMREHGVLDRVLLIYEAGLRKFGANEDFDTFVLLDSAQVVKDFIEDYHERAEEKELFPRFRRANQLTDLVDLLFRQHEAGRMLPSIILQTAPGSRKDGDDRHKLTGAVEAFIRMYRPHAAREDTDLFPKLRSLVSANEFDAIAEQFEHDERARFGEDGFGKMVDRVARLERMVGVNDLSQFTPPS
jgi:hemerythrin-like domain-containing protein